MTWAMTAVVLCVLIPFATDVAAEPAESPRTAAAVHVDPPTRHEPQRRDQPGARRDPAAPGKTEGPVQGRHGASGTGRGGRRGCLSTAETREVMSAKRLTPPFMALRAAGSHARGETIGVRLCRHGNDEFLYEINVLRRDGRVVKVILDAANGKVVRLINDR